MVQCAAVESCAAVEIRRPAYCNLSVAKRKRWRVMKASESLMTNRRRASVGGSARALLHDDSNRIELHH